MLWEIDGNTGKVVSTTDLGTQIRTAPAARKLASGGDRVFVTVGNGIACIESAATNGSAYGAGAPTTERTIKWRMNTTAFVYASPTVSADGATVFFGPSGDASVHALRADTGVPVWTSSSKALSASTKSAEGALSPDGKALYVIGQDPSNCNTLVVSLATDSGAPLWDPNVRPWKGATGSCSFPSALTVDGAGMVWIANGRGELLGFEPVSGNITRTCSYDALQGSGYSGGIAIGRDGLMVLVPDNGGILAVGE